MGLTVSVYKNPKYGDGTNGGVSADVGELTIVNVDGPFEPSEDRPAVILVEGPSGTAILMQAVNIGTDERPCWMPVAPRDKVGPMNGGNFAASTDSRFSRAVEKVNGHRFYGAIPIHDRYETAAQNALLST